MLLPRFLAAAGIALLRLSSQVSNTPVPITGATPAGNSATRLLGRGQTCPQRGCSSSAPRYLRQLDTKVLPDSACSGPPRGSVSLWHRGPPGRARAWSCADSRATRCSGDISSPCTATRPSSGSAPSFSILSGPRSRPAASHRAEPPGTGVPGGPGALGDGQGCRGPRCGGSSEYERR